MDLKGRELRSGGSFGSRGTAASALGPVACGRFMARAPRLRTARQPVLARPSSSWPLWGSVTALVGRVGRLPGSARFDRELSRCTYEGKEYFLIPGEEKKTTPQAGPPKVARELSLAPFCPGGPPVHAPSLHGVRGQGCSSLFQGAEHLQGSVLRPSRR